MFTSLAAMGALARKRARNVGPLLSVSPDGDFYGGRSFEGSPVDLFGG